jgi:hypothetical protein
MSAKYGKVNPDITKFFDNIQFKFDNRCQKRQEPVESSSSSESHSCSSSVDDNEVMGTFEKLQCETYGHDLDSQDEV